MQNITPQAEQPAANRQQKKNKKNRRRWLERLTRTWPEVFDLKKPRPLAVGIIDAITAELNTTGAGGHGAIRYALKSYTSNIRYVRALVEGGARYNLHGQPCGEISETERQQAAKRLKQMKKAKAQFFDQVTE